MTADDIPTAPARPTPVGALVLRVETAIEKLETLTRRLEGRNSNPPLPEPPTTPTVPSPEPRPSLAVKAAKETGKLTRALMIGTGILSVIGQVIAIWKPHYSGPIVEALRLLASLRGQ